MPEYEYKPAILLLEDGTIFKGEAAGKIGTRIGEICFCTGMSGYQEVFTDPSYYGQILIMTNVHIGNYGISEYEVESNSVKISGLVCKNFNVNFSRFKTNISIQDYFDHESIVGIAGVDTRKLVRHVRNKGAMNAVISSEDMDIDSLKKKLADWPSMKGLELSSKVSTKDIYTFGEPDAKHKVAVLDLGVKRNILRCLADAGCYMRVFPAKTSFDEMEEWGPEGYFISNGPGDPAAMTYAVKTVQTILKNNKPLFGICLGHQILAEAMGLETYKMHNGHRGLNHPVMNLKTGKSEITTQNHGFCVKEEAINQSDLVQKTHVNLNDDTIEGIKVTDKKAFSVQYHPEAYPGPHDSRYLFDDFIEMIKK